MKFDESLGKKYFKTALSCATMTAKDLEMDAGRFSGQLNPETKHCVPQRCRWEGLFTFRHSV